MGAGLAAASVEYRWSSAWREAARLPQLAVAALVPLALLPGALFHFDVTPKAVVLLAGAAAAAGLRGPALVRETKWLRWLLAAQVASLVFSTLFSTDAALSVAGTNWRRFGLIVQLGLLAYTYSVDADLRRPLLRVIAASGALAALYGIAQFFGFDPWLPRHGYHVGEGVWRIVRPPGTLGHAGYFAVYLLHVASAGLALWWEENERRWKWGGAAAAALAVAAIVLSGTRAALLGLAAGAVVLGWSHRPRLATRALALAALLAAAVAGFYFSSAGLQLRARARWFREDPFGGARLSLWADTLRMAAPRWLTGYGPETYSSQYPRFQSESLARRFPERYYESPHNIFLDALASQGLPGLAILALLAALGIAGLRSSPALLAGMLASLVANQFVVFTIPTALMFYLTVALGTAGQGRPVRRLAALPAVILLALGASGLAWTDWWLERARQSLDAGRVEQGLEDYRRARRFALPGLDTDLWYSRALLAAAGKIRAEATSQTAWREARAAAERAAARSEQRPNALYNLAAFRALENDAAGTEQALRAAIDWAPRWYKPRWMLAQLLERAGRLEEAAAQAGRAAELNDGKNPEVTQTRDRILGR